MPATPGVRRSLTEIQAEYENGDKEALETLMRAWKGIKALPWNDSRSFFTIGGYHGEPFRDEGATNPAWWGGYCEHGTVLFPTWHRAYLYNLEQVLQSIPGAESVMIPFWDETSAQSLAGGLPGALTWETFELDGAVIANPLRSFVLPRAIDDAFRATIRSTANPRDMRRFAIRSRGLSARLPSGPRRQPITRGSPTTTRTSRPSTRTW